jgi:PilZ domain-containing protein
MTTEKRRSDRIMLTIPLRVVGKDPAGGAFDEEGRSIALNRHGARIRSGRALRTGQTVRLVNQVTRLQADFRVVGPLAPLTGQGGEWGVEYLNSKENIWGIQFPPAQEGAPANSKALLECRHCHTAAVLLISMVEVEVLETAGIISRPCASCGTATLWGYSEKQLAMGAPPGEEVMIAEAQARIEEAESSADRRRHRRVCLQLPVHVRDYYGGVEITKSENVSKGGFCFASDKNYLMGQGILTMCPYNISGQNIEVRARIIRRTHIEGTQRKLYGVRYDAHVR